MDSRKSSELRAKQSLKEIKQTEESDSSDNDLSSEYVSPSEHEESSSESDNSWHTTRSSLDSWHSLKSSPQSSSYTESSDSTSDSSPDTWKPSDSPKAMQTSESESSRSSYTSTKSSNKSFTPSLFEVRTNRDLYQAKTKLGEGSYGSIYRARRESDGSYVAIKRMDLSVNQMNRDFEEYIVKMLIKNPHQNIVQFIETHSNRNETFLMSELSTIGDIYEVMQIKNQYGSKIWIQFDESLSRHLITGIARGLQHLHSIAIAHGDLKLHNILLFPNIDANQTTADPRGMITAMDRWTPKLTDFSNCQIGNQHNPTEPIIRDEPYCANSFAAPESCERIEYDAIKADLFSLGCCLLAMLLGSTPFETPLEPIDYANMPNMDQINEYYDRQAKYTNKLKYGTGFKREIVKMCSQPLRDLLEQLLDSNPQTRITLDQFLAHEWIARPKAREFEDIKDNNISYMKTHPCIPGIRYKIYAKDF